MFYIPKESRTSIKEEYFNYAIDLALNSKHKRVNNRIVKHGAVLLNRNKFVASGINLPSKTHPTQAFFSNRINRGLIYIHAEMNCLIQAKENADTILVSRVKGKNNQYFGLARPCEVCYTALQWFNIKTIWYTTEEQTWRREDIED